MFSVEDHYGSYMRKETIRALSQRFSLANKSVKTSKRKQTAGIPSVERQKIRYKDFVEISKKFTEYLSELKGGMSPSTFVNKMYMCELTGAKIKVVGGTHGIIVEERANSIVVVLENNSVKTYLKGTTDFIIPHNGIEYIFIGSKMKANRFIKK
ncbi:putative ribonuclease-like protein [Encephalitozoon intestinalis ATCC 50506]|uniref:Ribonuclease-like protein n=1 Tax=Encephalitozoon intestinalis (strain ATCC 50506) TaxID=876142 RepID=E0S886_ENCIT|nr:putative ribonuclease-like protein [Encephalitozoon intestinalis ATCC 50506]ADM11921.1 putative ribonuclease-like protein [Encephalitozoon intestinalis ATCC 50506]UTX45678.1 Hpop4-like protein [Encephalitozoon intestinalis]